MKSLILGIILVWSAPARGEVPEFTTLKQGEVAPFDGRLFNNAAVSKFIVEYKLKAEECNIQIDYEVGKAKTEERYNYDLLYAKSESDNQRLTDMIEIRNEHIKNLEKYVRPSNAHWWTLGGFAVGATATIGIMYAIAPGLK